MIEPGRRELAALFEGATRPQILLGQLSGRHPEFGRLRLLAGAIARATGATLGYVTEGANAAGAALAGLSAASRGRWQPAGQART